MTSINPNNYKLSDKTANLTEIGKLKKKSPLNLIQFKVR